MKAKQAKMPLSELDLQRDTWVIPSPDHLADYTFYFDFLPNQWIKNEVKNYVIDTYEAGNIEVSTLHRYNYTLRHFFDALKAGKVEIATFADITRETIELFIWHLNLQVKSASTRSVSFSALKSLIQYGTLFEREGYPLKNLFDRTDFRTLATEDILKSKVIPDDVMKKIEAATVKLMKSEKEKDVLTGCLITIIMHTGIRLSEALELNENSIHTDLQGKPLLEVVSEKNKTDRYIAIRREVVEAVERLKTIMVESRQNLGTNKLFVYRSNRRKDVFVTQYKARKDLAKIVVKQNIEHELTFHMFRHTLATSMLAKGMSLFEIRNYLGHESMHSTRLYARVSDSNLHREYRKLGFIGLIGKTAEEAVDEKQPLDRSTRLMAQLPDGVCARPIKEKVSRCRIPNACLFCQKFITTPEFLEIHKDHLRRIREDKEAYKLENFVGTDYLIQETESALVEIISRLEGLVNEGG